jgi:hypothetical protein
MNPSATYAQPKRSQTRSRAPRRGAFLPSAPSRLAQRARLARVGWNRIARIFWQGPPTANHNRATPTRQISNHQHRMSARPPGAHPEDILSYSARPPAVPPDYYMYYSTRGYPRLLPVLQYPRVALELRGYARAYLGGVGIAVEVLE